MRPSRTHEPVTRKMLRALMRLKDDAGRRQYLRRHPQLFRKTVVLYLNDFLRGQLRSDPNGAGALSEATLAIAHRVRSPEALARSLRSRANALYMVGDNQRAIEFHGQALRIFRQIRDAREEARTLIPSIQPLILLGEYDRAFETAAVAKAILERIGDRQRLGHLEINIGNIYHRQDRFEEGLARYERAYEMLLPFRDSEGLAVALYNMAVCLISLNDFARALATYERARAMCVQNDMPLLVTQADYNIAYLHYLRGEYSLAIELLRATREKCEKNGDAHILALCYLDLSEIYLELNLSADAWHVAHQGYKRFRKLGMGYEEAKCLANEAMALSQLGHTHRALELFDRTRAIFVREKNRVWPWLIDLYRALVLCNEGRSLEARRFCAVAVAFFDQSLLPGKAVLSHLLLARLSLQTGDIGTAKSECSRALEQLSSLETPVLRFQAEFLSGQIHEASGEPAPAYASYQQARGALESLRGSLSGEELKIAFVKNRLAVYERLVDIRMNNSAIDGAAEETFGYIEMAKSRSLAELLARQGEAIPDVGAGKSGLMSRIREMREELNWYYRRLEIEQLQGDDPARERVEKLRRQVLAHENELLRAFREIPASQQLAYTFPPVSVDRIRAALPPDSALAEYFSVKDQFVAAILTRQSLEIVPLAPVSRVTNLIRMLDFQIGKFHLGGEYIREFEKPLFQAIQVHLRSLYIELFSPLRRRLSCRHLVIVPHGPLHYVPFHALFDSERYLIDSYTISYAPSATVFAVCQERAVSATGPPLVMGVPDIQAPFIREEVMAVAQTLPGAQVFLGRDATDAIFRKKGSQSRTIHLATHGTFRQDNPMFSGIRLGETYLSLYDLYQLKVECELFTLSGCATGVNVVASGDELLGLTRGLLYAGARSVLLTLWNVHDLSTAEFMTAFYRHWKDNSSKPMALRAAMLELRDRYPHPYYWAPFALTGRISPV